MNISSRKNSLKNFQFKVITNLYGQPDKGEDSDDIYQRDTSPTFSKSPGNSSPISKSPSATDPAPDSIVYGFYRCQASSNHEIGAHEPIFSFNTSQQSESDESESEPAVKRHRSRKRRDTQQLNSVIVNCKKAVGSPNETNDLLPLGVPSLTRNQKRKLKKKRKEKEKKAASSSCIEFTFGNNISSINDTEVPGS